MARFDLNLLGALEALLTEQNVTRAAEKLNLTQPTVSGMLQRLRYQFNDQLLVRNGRQMELTPFAASLIDPVRETLRGVELLMHAEPAFEPETSTREFTLMMSDYCASIFLPDVVARITNEAPGVRIIVKPIDSPVERMTSGDIDLCITADDLTLFGCDSGKEKLQSEILFSDEFVCIVAEDHPLTHVTDIEGLLSYPHVGVEMAGAIGTIETISLRQYAPMYKPNIVVPDFSQVASMVARSRLIGVIQSRLVDVVRHTLPIRPLILPINMPSLNEAMLWHSRHIEDPAHSWLRGILRNVADNWGDAGSKPDQRRSGWTPLHVVN